jgi:DNA modification methylase
VPETRILVGDCRETLATLPAGSVQCCVTSPPYFGLRQYLPDVVRLRADLSAQERAAVLAELAALGVVPVDHTSE